MAENWTCDFRFEPSTQILTVRHAPEEHVWAGHVRDYYARFWVMRHLHPTGWFYNHTPASVKANCYRLADGFSEPPDYYDWSHIRDSSTAAFVTMADFIARAMYRWSYQDQYCAWRADLARGPMRPDEYFTGATA